MLIKQFEIENYKGFDKPRAIALQDGFNVVTGQNNAGKTALLEALALRLKNTPHRSIHTIPRRGGMPSGQPTIHLTVSFSGREWQSQLLQQAEYFLPMPLQGDGTPFDRPYARSWDFGADRNEIEQYKQWLFSQPEIPFEFVGVVKEAGDIDWKAPSRNIDNRNYIVPSLSLLARNYHQRPNGNRYFWRHNKAASSSSQPQTHSLVSAGELNSTLTDAGLCLTPLLAQETYLFRAERLSLAQCPVGTAIELAPNAANLAEVLSNLQSNRARFDRFNELVREVLQIKGVSVRNIADNRLEILVWNEDPATERDDLAVSLSESGTGVGQVLAILAVLVTAEEPRVLVIDEPQSFLHPGAARKLLQILKRHYIRHQYIIATHSAAVISETSPKTITLVRKEGAASDLKSLDATQRAALGSCLSELGAHLSDVFGADRVLWVEGPTEEEGFKIVLEEVAHFPLHATAILGVKHTGDLEGKDAERIYDIYNKLSDSPGLLPPAVRYIFDSEGRSIKLKSDLIRKSQGRVAFLPRRLYENYLIDAAAIVAVANSNADFRPGNPLTVEEVTEWLEKNKPLHIKTKHESAPQTKDNQGNELPWESYGHGANLLSDLFKEFSESVVYSKTTHSVELTQWLAQNKPEFLKELADFLVQQLQEASLGNASASSGKR